eukprot:GHRQ01024550.1.p1 GENE.GHRQ01024550.1~~GHRQ01024550.1.p1  ORF type:complete len:188 (-),score=35.14 GHRQ01024550.1:314-877(-)
MVVPPCYHTLATSSYQAEAHRACLQVLWECGGTLAAPAIASGVIHKVLAFIAPKIIGGERAPTPVGELGNVEMTQSVSLLEPSWKQVRGGGCGVRRGWLLGSSSRDVVLLGTMSVILLLPSSDRGLCGALAGKVGVHRGCCATARQVVVGTGGEAAGALYPQLCSHHLCWRLDPTESPCLNFPITVC